METSLPTNKLWLNDTSPSVTVKLLDISTVPWKEVSDIIFNDISVHLETNEPILLEPNLNKLYLKLVDQDGTTELENLSTQSTHNSLWSSRTTKEYVDAVSEGLHILEPCLAGSFGNYLNTYTHLGYAVEDQTQPPVHIDYNSTLQVDFTSQSNSLNGLNASDGTTNVTGLQSYDTNTNTYKTYTGTPPSPNNLQDGSYTITGHQGDYGKGALFQFTISNSGNSIGNIKCIRAGQGYKSNGTDNDKSAININSKNTFHYFQKMHKLY